MDAGSPPTATLLLTDPRGRDEMWEGSACAIHLHIGGRDDGHDLTQWPDTCDAHLRELPGCLPVIRTVAEELLKRAIAHRYVLLLDPLGPETTAPSAVQRCTESADIAAALQTLLASDPERLADDHLPLLVWGWPEHSTALAEPLVMEFRAARSDRYLWRRLITAHIFMITVTYDALSISVQCDHLAALLNWLEEALRGRVGHLQRLQA